MQRNNGSDDSSSDQEQSHAKTVRQKHQEGASESSSLSHEGRSREFLVPGQLRAALARAKYSQLIDSDEPDEQESVSAKQTVEKQADKEDSKDTASLKSVSTISSTKGASGRYRKESSSSYAEDDHPSLKQQTFNDFGYQELDDEYGSRPVDVAGSVSSKSSHTDSVAMQFIPNSDRIVGHEYGVRPLLDDDELQDEYGGQTHGWSKPVTDNNSWQDSIAFADSHSGKDGVDNMSNTVSVISDSGSRVDSGLFDFPSSTVGSDPAQAEFVAHGAMTTSSSSVLSPDTSSTSTNVDVFSAAPFKFRSSKRSTPLLASGTSSSVSGQGSDVFDHAPFKSGRLVKGSSLTNVTSPGSSSYMSYAAMDGNENQTRSTSEADVFGSAPFAVRATPCSTDPSSSTVSPLMEDIMYVATPEEALPGRASENAFTNLIENDPHHLGYTNSVTIDSQDNEVFSNVSVDTSEMLPRHNNSNNEADPVTFRHIAEDPFGAVPFNKAMKRSIKRANTQRASKDQASLVHNMSPQNDQKQISISGDTVSYFPPQFPQQDPSRNLQQQQQQQNNPPPTQMPQHMHPQNQLYFPSQHRHVPQPSQSQPTIPVSLPTQQQQQPFVQAKHQHPEIHSLQQQQQQQQHQLHQQQLQLHQQQLYQQTKQQQNTEPLWKQQSQQLPLHLGSSVTTSQQIANRNKVQRPLDLPVAKSPSSVSKGSASLSPQDPPKAPLSSRQKDPINEGEWDMQGGYDDEGKYQRLKMKASSSKRSSRDVTTSAFSNMSFNDEDEMGERALSSEHSHSISPSAGVGSGGMGQRSVYSPSSGDLVRQPVIAVAASYDTGTWPRKHKRHSKAEPFSKK